jgi:hypothetical protein
MLLMGVRTVLAAIMILPSELRDAVAVAILVFGLSVQFFVNPFNSKRENSNEFCGYVILLSTFTIQSTLVPGTFYNTAIVIIARIVNFLFVLVNLCLIGRAFYKDYKKK